MQYHREWYVAPRHERHPTTRIRHRKQLRCAIHLQPASLPCTLLFYLDDPFQGTYLIIQERLPLLEHLLSVYIAMGFSSIPTPSFGYSVKKKGVTRRSETPTIAINSANSATIQGVTQIN